MPRGHHGHLVATGRKPLSQSLGIGGQARPVRIIVGQDHQDLQVDDSSKVTGRRQACVSEREITWLGSASS